MKKWMLLLAGIILIPVVASAQQNKTLFEGNLSLGTVLQRIMRNERLPLYISDTHSFDSRSEKNRAIEAVRKQLNKGANYWTYYNAAVVYSAGDTARGWDEEPYLNERDAANAVLFASKAIDLYKKKPAQAVYMYLVRGETYFTRSVLVDVYGGAHLVKQSMEGQARAALADFQQVEKINANLAPYWKMESAARVLNKTELAAKYKKLSIERQKRDEAKYHQYQAMVKAKMTVQTLKIKRALRSFKPFFGLF